MLSASFSMIFQQNVSFCTSRFGMDSCSGPGEGKGWRPGKRAKRAVAVLRPEMVPMVPMVRWPARKLSARQLTGAVNPDLRWTPWAESAPRVLSSFSSNMHQGTDSDTWPWQSPELNRSEGQKEYTKRATVIEQCDSDILWWHNLL